MATATETGIEQRLDTVEKKLDTLSNALASSHQHLSTEIGGVRADIRDLKESLPAIINQALDERERRAG